MILEERRRIENKICYLTSMFLYYSSVYFYYVLLVLYIYAMILRVSFVCARVYERKRERETCKHPLIEDSLDITLSLCLFIVGMRKPVKEGQKFLEVPAVLC